MILCKDPAQHVPGTMATVTVIHAMNSNVLIAVKVSHTMKLSKHANLAIASTQMIMLLLVLSVRLIIARMKDVS